MPKTISQRDPDADYEARSQRLDRQMRFLWMPGRRKRLAKESYDIGHVCRQHGNVELAESNFRRVFALFQGNRPIRTKESLDAFALVAAAHNHLGLLRLDAGRSDDSLAAFDRAIEIRGELRRLFPDDRENQVYLGGALCNRAHTIADVDATAAIVYYQRSLAVLRQPTQSCECSYWDKQRQSWWCEQLEALRQALGLQWVALAPQFIDNAMTGLERLLPPSAPPLNH